MAEMVTDAAALSAAAGQVDFDFFGWVLRNKRGRSVGTHGRIHGNDEESLEGCKFDSRGRRRRRRPGSPATWADYGLLFA